MVEGISALAERRELLWAWTWRTIRARYKQTMLGGLWAVIQPLALMFVFSIIFTRFVVIDTGDIAYPIFSYTALLPWTLFTTSLTGATSSLIDNIHLVTKVYFPREIFPISAISAKLVDFAIASGVFVLMLVYYQVTPQLTWLWAPVLLLIMLALVVGLGLFASAVTVFYRDVRHAITLLLQVWMYATPIIYPLERVPESLRGLYALNPMVGIIDSFRRTILLGEAPNMDYLLPSIVISLVALFGGYLFFKRVEWQFGDII